MDIVISRIFTIARIIELKCRSCFFKLVLASAIYSLLPVSVYAATLTDVDAVPHLDSAGKQGYRKFLAAEGNRAFAIGPGGAWSWKAEDETAELASGAALQSCENASGLSCLLYAVNDKLVFDEKIWVGLWGPYQNRAEAKQAYIGKERGDRFFNLAFKSASGKMMKLAELKGKVTILHFWGSWCPSCLREMPELQQLYNALGTTNDIQMVLLQVRESFSTGQLWMRQHQINLPLFDSRVKDVAPEMLVLSGGREIHDREIAAAFPTTYILDKYGIVVFSHVGSISDWMQYLPLLRDVAARSGK